LIQRLHAILLTGLDRRIHLRHLVFTDQVTDGRNADHDFMRRHATRAVLGFQQGLRNNGAQRFGQHGTNHFLFRGREHVNDTVNGFGRRRGVQRSEHQMPCFCGGQRQAYRFQIAHFTDQNHVRVFAQCRAQRVRERQRMRADFALVDQALFGLVHKFDRIFDRKDVAVVVFVDEIDHGGQRRRFTRTSRAGHQHQASRILGNFLEHARRIEFFQRQHLGRNGPEYSARATLLIEGVNPETGQIGNFERKVTLESIFVNLALPVIHDVVHHVMHVFMFKRRQINAANIAMNPNHRRQTRRKMQIGCFVLDCKSQQFGNFHLLISLQGRK